MKISQTIAALLATAILCIALVSCDRNPVKDDASSAETSNEEVLSTFESADTSTTGNPETEEEPPTGASTTLPGQSTTAGNTTAVTPTKVTTTAPSTTKPVTTTAPSTTVPSTTVPSSTVPDITTTAPNISTQTTITPPVTERPTDIVTDSETMYNEQTVIAAINRYRVEEGLGELAYSPELSAAADIRAKELSESFSHIRPVGGLFNTISPLAKAENIAKGYSAAEQVAIFWAKNEGYREVMLTKNFTLTGVGCYYDNATDTYYWVQLFG